MTVSVFLRWVVLPGALGACVVFALLWVTAQIVNGDWIERIDDRLHRRSPR